MGVNIHKDWDVAFDLFPRDNKIVKHIYLNKLGFLNPN